jgi:hypothetical protein
MNDGTSFYDTKGSLVCQEVITIPPLLPSALLHDYHAVEKRSSAALRYKPHRSTYFRIRLALRFLRALHLSIFEQPAKQGVFQHPAMSSEGRR